jgi:hypothetical protein
VSVAAVRDLYGAVINEGANKGILVTTSDYYSDAYEFIRGKPLHYITNCIVSFSKNTGKPTFVSVYLKKRGDPGFGISGNTPGSTKKRLISADKMGLERSYEITQITMIAAISS